MKKISTWGFKNETIPAGELAAAQNANLIFKESYQISSSRSIAKKIELEVGENDLLHFVFEDGTTWMGGSDMLYDLYPDAAKKKRAVQSDVFEIPASLRSDENQRGLLGDIALKVLNVFAKKAVKFEVKKIAAKLEKKQLANMSGLYSINEDFAFSKIKKLEPGNTYLLFIHGTNSSTAGSFGELKNTELWKFITATYKQNILGLQHETLTKSPIQNVIDIFTELPSSCTLHVITHSRGGLVGDVLARFSNGNIGFTAQELDYLNKEEFKRKKDVEDIATLSALAAKKTVTVEKYLRVACPASGTTILSSRLDHFLNISFNLLSLLGPAAALVAGEFKELVAAAVSSKNTPEDLPGLEAMNPDSPFLKVLNNPGTEINGSLTVISGNCGIKFNLKALLIIASKLFYLRDNDLVVDTKSMYCGSKRKTENSIQYFFDEGPEVDHVHYFKNKKTQDAMLFALKAANGQAIPTFSRLNQEDAETLRRNILLKLEGGKTSEDKVTGKKPIVILLPGIMGSNLESSGSTIWINYLRFLVGDLTRLDISKKTISATSLVKTSYGELVKYLKSEYDVVTFPFDWRRSLPEAAALLKDRIEKLLPLKQPIKIIGHSMGGVVARDFIIHHPQTWAKLNKTKDFKLLLLGAPLGGSHRIPYVLAGKDPIINKLSKVDIIHTKKELLDMFRRFPGLLALLPLEKNPKDYADIKVWQEMKQASVFDWNIPDNNDLISFDAYRNKIVNNNAAIDFSNIIYIAGKDDATVCGYEINNDLPGEKIIFKSTAEGDQSVTWESGIPKALQATDRLYYVNVSHGSLANEEDIFKGIEEILKNGKTNLLSNKKPALRSEALLFDTVEEETWDVSERSLEDSLLGIKIKAKGEKKGSIPINTSVSNGDLYYSRYPVLVGHFTNDGITSAEKVIDNYSGNVMSHLHKLNQYPGKIGTNELFINFKEEFKGAVVVGLGDPGKLSSFQLTKTTEQAIVKYLLELRTITKSGGADLLPKETGISVLLIGGGYGGLSVENSVRSIIQGIQNANEKIGTLSLDNIKTIETIEFVELYEDRCLQCLYALRRFEKEDDAAINIRLSQKKLKKLLGACRRIPKDTDMGWWKRIGINLNTTVNEDDGLMETLLRFSCSTGSAREEQRNLQTSPEIIDELIEEMSTDNKWNPGLAKTIFELLIPNDFKDEIKKQSNTMWIVDNAAAAYPWELLQDSANNAKPLCYNAGMIRQLAIEDYDIKVNAVAENKALIIGDPDLNGYPGASQLPGAFKEANAVAAKLEEAGFEMPNNCFQKSSTQIIKALFKDDYKIIHLSGHGIFNEDRRKPTGMLIGNGIFLTTKEIAQMSTVPELVFINCCFLGKVNAAAETRSSRYKLAANIGTQLIKKGVKAVIAAGWAVEDDAAEDFAATFYKEMLDGRNFGDAVQTARKKIFSPHNNTWGAYQCYGDPYYVLTRPKATAKPPVNYMMAEEAEIDLYNLINKSDAKNGDMKWLTKELEDISVGIEKANFVNAATIEKQAMAYAELNDYGNAIIKFKSLLNLEHAGFSVTALEKYCNVRAKKCVQDWKENIDKSKQPAKLEEVIKDIKQLIKIGATAERYSLLGSAYKRKSIITPAAINKIAALQEAAYYYQLAVQKEDNKYKTYTLTNWLEIENVLVLLKKAKWGAKAKKGYSLPKLDIAMNGVFDIVNLIDTHNKDVDFWDKISSANATLCMLLLQNGSTDAFSEEKVIAAYTRIWNSAGSKNKKVTEREHFDFLLSTYTLVKGSAPIRRLLKTIQEALEASIS